MLSEGATEMRIADSEFACEPVDMDLLIAAFHQESLGTMHHVVNPLRRASSGFREAQDQGQNLQGGCGQQGGVSYRAVLGEDMDALEQLCEFRLFAEMKQSALGLECALRP